MRSPLRLWLLLALLGLGLLRGARAAAGPELSPGTRYDAKVPSLGQVAGHDFGEEISSPEQITLYLKALAAAAPDRTHLIEYGRTWEGRPLHCLVVGSPRRIARLDQLRKDLGRLAAPQRLAPAEADSLVRDLPVVVWLMHAVHGDEVSSADAALAEAYHLLAARDDAGVEQILREAVVLIDPLANPDGRARFLYQHHLARAAEPDAEPAAAEHDQPWPGGRSNHYLFDMNRDWFAQTQPETRGRTRLFLDWFPQVVVDLHEMGGESSYYFPPPAEPLNPFITKEQAGWFQTFGQENAKRFDERGFAYFNREVYDSFYPGYGESWPIFHGAVGMTYEQAGAAGLRRRREDGEVLTYRDGVVRHFTAALETLRTAAAHRERLLRDFLEYRRSAVREGESGPTRAYLVPPGIDPARTERLARMLLAQGFEVLRAEEAVPTPERTLPAGTYVVPLAQPGGRLLRNLIEPHVPQSEEFVREQDRRRKRRMPDQIYDLTAWSLPLAFDVEVVSASQPVTVRTAPLATAEAGSAAPLPAAKVGYLLPWGAGTAAAVTESLRGGIKVRTADRGFRLSGRDYPAGTAIVRVAENPTDLAVRLGAIAARHGARATPIDTAFVESGISLGSNEVAALKPPRVLLAWDAPASTLSAGWTRYVLERRYGQPVTAVRAGSLGRVELWRFDVLVVPAGTYGAQIGAEQVRRLRDWISSGGTLILLGEASRWAAQESVGLLEARSELRDGKPETAPPDPQAKNAPAPRPFDLEKGTRPERERPENTPGAMLRVILDPEHWLAAGTDGEIQAVVEGQRVFTPVRLDKGRNAGVYPPRDRLVAGGLVWPEAQEQLAQKAFLIDQPVGHGHVIAFAEDPNYRAFTEGTMLLFMNAVLLGPAH